MGGMLRVSHHACAVVCACSYVWLVDALVFSVYVDDRGGACMHHMCLCIRVWVPVRESLTTMVVRI
jgi:hypothetical protein